VDRASPIDFALVGVLTILWGSAFALIEIALVDFSPAMIAFLRIALAAVLVAVYAIIKGDGLPRTRQHWALCFALGFFGFAAPFTLVPYGQEYVNSGTAAILMAVSPISTMLFAHFLTSDEKLTPRRTFGVTLGFLGIVILFGADAARVNMSIGAAALVSAALCYAIAGIVMKRMRGFPDLSSSAGALIAATLICIPALALRQDFGKLDTIFSASFASLLSIAVLALGATGLAAILVLIIIRRRGATFTATSNYGVPAFGVLVGVVFLNEPLQWNILVTLVLILTAIWLTSNNGSKPEMASPEQA